MPKTRIVRSYQAGKRSEEIPILKENEKIVIATFVPASEKINGYIEYVIEEQEDIANNIDEKSKEIDQMIARKENLIEELESYKKSLIYEYVTGKKEVPACP